MNKIAQKIFILENLVKLIFQTLNKVSLKSQYEITKILTGEFFEFENNLDNSKYKIFKNDSEGLEFMRSIMYKINDYIIDYGDEQRESILNDLKILIIKYEKNKNNNLPSHK